MIQVTAIVLAAGKGLRFKSKVPKVLAEINSKPILIYSLLALNRHPFVKDIVLVVNSGNANSIVKKAKLYRIEKINRIVKGGKRRQDSVLNGLKALGAGSDLVLIHDCARPFIDKNIISAVITEAKKTGAAIVGVPVKATVKSVKVSKFQGVKVEKTLDRNNLWEIQTPQVFNKGLLLEAYNKFGNTNVTDDASLVEKLKIKPSVVLGSYKNIKITTVEDLVIAKAIAKRA